MGFPGSSASKESTCNTRDLGSITGLGTFPGERHRNPLQYSCLENSHGQRSLEDYSPWGHKESDTLRLRASPKKTGAGERTYDCKAKVRESEFQFYRLEIMQIFTFMTTLWALPFLSLSLG